MTKRAFWDFFGALWELNDDNTMTLLWSPFGPIVGRPMCISRAHAEIALGPLVGVA